MVQIGFSIGPPAIQLLWCQRKILIFEESKYESMRDFNDMLESSKAASAELLEAVLMLASGGGGASAAALLGALTQR